MSKQHSIVELSDSEDADKKPAAASSSSVDNDEKPSLVPPPVDSFFTRPSEEGLCLICFCDYSTQDGVLLSECSHEFCQDCLMRYVQTKVKDGEVLATQLACPHIDVDDKNKKCGCPLSQANVLACLDTSQDRDRYFRLSLSRAVDQYDNLAYCPTAGCFFQFELDQDNRKLDCPLCNQSYCLVCKTRPWHSGVRCEQYQQERKAQGKSETGDDDEDFLKFASKKKLKQCPKCKFWVEKTMGCDAMHCRCTLVFCYNCGGCLKDTALKNGFKECKCPMSRVVLETHERSPANHNLMPGPVPGAIGRPGRLPHNIT